MIAGMSYYEIAWYFLFYSFAGWCIEVIYHAIVVGKVINRGFLCGPVCPVYGFGILAVFSMTKALLPSLFHISERRLTDERDLAGVLLVFLGGMVLTTSVELLAGWLLDVAFHARWWDYSDQPLQFHGYICLRFSLLWGLAVVLVVRLIQPLLEQGPVLRLPARISCPILGLLYAVYLADFIITVLIVAGLNRQLRELDEIQQKMRIVSDGLSQRLATGSMQAQQTLEESRVQATLAKYEAREALGRQAQAAAEARGELGKKRQQLQEEALAQREDLARKAEDLKRKLTSHPVFGPKRLLFAFPHMQHRNYPEIVKRVQKLLHG